MRKIFLSLVVIFLTISKAFALEITTEDQVGIVGQKIELKLSATQGKIPYIYSVSKSDIAKSQWSINKDVFQWTPVKKGLYFVNFVVIDKDQSYQEKKILFSIIDKSDVLELSQEESNTKKEEEKIKEKKEAKEENDKYIKKIIPETRNTYYIRGTKTTSTRFYQPISFYYFKGKAPFDIILERFKQNLKLYIYRGTYFKKNKVMFYSGELNPPLWMSRARFTSMYNTEVPVNAVAFAQVDFGRGISVDGKVYLSVSKNIGDRYHIFYPRTNTITDSRKFVKNRKILIAENAVVIFTENF